MQACKHIWMQRWRTSLTPWCGLNTTDLVLRHAPSGDLVLHPDSPGILSWRSCLQYDSSLASCTTAWLLFGILYYSMAPPGDPVLQHVLPCGPCLTAWLPLGILSYSMIPLGDPCNRQYGKDMCGSWGNWNHAAGWGNQGARPASKGRGGAVGVSQWKGKEVKEMLQDVRCCTTISNHGYAQSRCHCALCINHHVNNHNKNRVLLWLLFQENKSFGSKAPFAFILWCLRSCVEHNPDLQHGSPWRTHLTALPPSESQWLQHHLIQFFVR